MKTKFKILIAFMALLLVNYSSWGQRRIGNETINLTSISDLEVIKFVSGTNPQVKNDYPSTILLALPVGVGSAVSLPASGITSIAYAGGYSAGGPASKSFFIIFFH